MRKNKFLLFQLLFLSISQILFSQPTITRSSSEIYLDLRKSTVLGSVLYIAAHPDDENTGLLAYYSKGKNYRTAYLSLTRGDGGQNLIGSEKGDEIGIIRTYELLEARKIDGAQQFFTRAVDFGYSKSVEETLDFWNKDSVLSDIVWVIRKFRPDVIITRFPPEGYQTHGHHISSALLAVEAFHAAGDSSRFPHQLKYLETWSPVRIYWNTWRPQVDTSINKSDLITTDVGEYNPVLGLSYSEMSALSRSKHKSQGFGTRGSRGSSLNYFQYLDGLPASKDLFEDIDVSWNRVKNGLMIDTILQEALRKFNPEHPSATIPLLVQAIKTNESALEMIPG